MIKVAIVGAGGQVGSSLLAHLAGRAGVRAWGVCRNELTAGSLRLAGLEVRRGAVGDPNVAPELVGDADVVINCAASSALPGQSRVEDRAVVETLAALPGRKRFVHFSSVGIYGSCCNPQRNTFDQPRPDWPFGRDKLHIERYFARRLRGTMHEAFVLRLGHVYGPGTWLSRYVLAAAQDPSRALPFDGALPSNAIHVRNICTAVRTLIEGQSVTPGTYNLLDAPATTWRQVFDWNTKAVGLPSVRALDDQAATHDATHHRNLAATPLGVRLVAEAASWTRGLPTSFLAASPTTKNLGVIVLSTLRAPALVRRVMLTYNKTLTRRSVGLTVREAYLFSERVPGPQLTYQNEMGERESTELARWFQGYATPDALLNWDNPPSTNVIHAPV
jgi:nucleoside-diphosphate-sugar epimerase